MNVEYLHQFIESDPNLIYGQIYHNLCDAYDELVSPDGKPKTPHQASLMNHHSKIVIKHIVDDAMHDRQEPIDPKDLELIIKKVIRSIGR